VDGAQDLWSGREEGGLMKSRTHDQSVGWHSHA